MSVALCVEGAKLRRVVTRALTASALDFEVESVALEEVAARSTGDPQPDCVVLSVLRPDKRALGSVMAPIVALQRRGVAFVLICAAAAGAEIRRAVELGIAGVVLEEQATLTLAATVSAAAVGQVVVPHSHSAGLRPQALTSREREILSLVVMGLSNGQIARQLFLAESTVKSHLSSAFAKLGVSSRNEAVRLILDPDRGLGLGILTIPAEQLPSPV